MKPKLISSPKNSNRMRFMETRDFMMSEFSDTISAKPMVSVGRKERKLSHNVFSPRK
jgi:hypothetical protein